MFSVVNSSVPVAFGPYYHQVDGGLICPRIKSTSLMFWNVSAKPVEPLGEELAWTLQAGSCLLGAGSTLPAPAAGRRRLCSRPAGLLSCWGRPPHLPLLWALLPPALQLRDARACFPYSSLLLEASPVLPCTARLGHHRAQLPSNRIVTCIYRIV